MRAVLVISLVAQTALAADGGTPGYLNCRVTQSFDDGGNSWVVSVFSSPLPVDAARASKQPDFGRPGTPSTEVLSVQGVPFGKPLRVDASGIPVTIIGVVQISDAGAPLNINPPASLPLPASAATDARQDTGNTSLSNIDGKLPALVSSRVPVDPSSVTSPVSATSLPLPTGASTAARQDTGNTSLSNIDGKLPALVSSRVPVDPSGVTSPVSATSLPLPTGASTAARQDTGNTSLSNIDGKLPALVSSRVPVDPSGVTSPVSAASLPLPAGASTDATLSQLFDGGMASLGRQADGSLHPIAVDASGVLFVNAIGGPMPSRGNALTQPCNAVRRSNCR